jgi:hypothetical protein
MHHQQAGRPVSVQLDNQLLQQQATSRKCLHVIFTSIKYLGMEGLAFQGHDNDDGHFMQLLRLRAGDVPEMVTWLERHCSFTSSGIQNEILGLIASAVQRTLLTDIMKTSPLQYAVIVDGTRDISGIEQECICLRHVDKDFQPVENFMGFYSTEDCTGGGILRLILDSLVRFNLPVLQLRGQAYDGAANMSGAYSGCQALLKQHCSIALYVHCGAHCVNLVMENVACSVAAVRDAIQCVHDVGTMSSQSTKFKNLFASVSFETGNAAKTLRPLCPTRWAVRVAGIETVLLQYTAVIEALEQHANSNSSMESCARAAGLQERFSKGNTYAYLIIAVTVFRHLENLCVSLQGRSQTISGTRQAVDIVHSELIRIRSDEEFTRIFDNIETAIEKLDLEPLQLPRPRNAPKRYNDGAAGHHPTTSAEFFRTVYFELLDTAAGQIQSRFDQESFRILEELEGSLLTGTVGSVIKQYPEIDTERLAIQLPMFRDNYRYSSTSEAAEVLRTMTPEVRHLFGEVGTLVRCMLVVPASTCEAERSFSSLRRLKTYIRSTMTQKRLNNVAMCHVYKDRLSQLDVTEIMREFVKLNDRRATVFGII